MSFLFGSGPKPAYTPMQEQELQSQVQGRTYLVVGGTKGIGAAVVDSLSKRGAAKVVVVGRSLAEDKLKALPSNVEFVSCDVSTMKGNQNLVRNQLKGQTFDTVVFTVGVISRSTLTRTSEGIEEDLAISYLSRFVICKELLEAKALVGRKRIYIMGYPGEDMKIENLDDLNFDNTPYKQWPAHFNTVVLNEALVYELAKRHPEVHVFGLNPGLIKTGIRDNFHGGSGSILGRIMETLLGWFTLTPEQYVEQFAFPSIVSPEFDNKTAICFSNKSVILSPKTYVSDQSKLTKCWEASEALVAKATQPQAIQST